MDGSGERAVVQEVFSHGPRYEYFRLRAPFNIVAGAFQLLSS